MIYGSKIDVYIIMCMTIYGSKMCAIVANASQFTKRTTFKTCIEFLLEGRYIAPMCMLVNYSPKLKYHTYIATWLLGQEQGSDK